MKLSEPTISLKLPYIDTKEDQLLLNFYKELTINPFKPKDFYCADGFPKEGDSCFVVVP